MPTTVIVGRELLGQTKMHVFGALRSARAMAFINTLSLLILLIKYPQLLINVPFLVSEYDQRKKRISSLLGIE